MERRIALRWIQGGADPCRRRDRTGPGLLVETQGPGPENNLIRGRSE
jgi:hypothetical protein